MNNIHVKWVFFSNNERFQAVMKACIALVVTILQHFLEYTKFFAQKSINLIILLYHRIDIWRKRKVNKIVMDSMAALSLWRVC